MNRPVAALGAIVLGLAAAPSAAQVSQPSAVAAETSPSSASTAAQRLIERFRLFPSLTERPCCELSGATFSEPKRLLHQAGDPDSLFTLGSPTPQGELRIQAAVEVNEVILRALAPDLRVDPTDTRSRAAGDYRALDATGRPYQLRLGAKLVW